MTISGDYKLTLSTPLGKQDGSLHFEADNGCLQGKIENARGSAEFDGGSVKDGEVAFETRIPTPLGRMKAQVTGRVEGDHFSGDAKLPLGTAHIEGDRLN